MATLGTRMARAAVWQMLGNLLRVVLGMVASVAMVRWLGAEQFGKASWVISLVMYVSVLFSGGIGIPFTRNLTHLRLNGGRRSAFLLVGRIWLIRILVSALILIICLGIRNLSLGLPDRLAADDPLKFVPFLVLVGFLHGSMIRVLQVNFRPGIVSALAVVEIVVKVGLLRLIGGATPGADALILAALGSEAIALVGAACAGFRILSQLEPDSASTTQPPPASGFADLLASGRPVWLLSIAQRILGRDVDILLLGLLAGPLEVARYALPFTLAAIGLSVATSVFQSTTAISAFTESGTVDSPTTQSRLLKAMLEYWLVFVTPIAVGGILLGGRILHFLYGEAAQGTAMVAALLFAAFAIGELASLGKDALHGMNMDHRPARAHMAGGTLNLVASIVLIPHLGAEGAALATLLATITVTFIEFRFLFSRLCCAPGKRPLVTGALALLVLVVTVLTTNRIDVVPFDSLIGLLMTICIAGCTYLATLAVIEPRTSLREGCATGPAVLRFIRKIL